jgi:hypothetical protein
VLNGGVFGYGLDQIALRAETLLERYRPDVLVASLIPDDVRRCELSMRSGSYMPYFELAPGGLALRNVPVPPPESPNSRLGRPRALLGHSFAVHWLMLRVDPETWLTGTRWGRRRVSSQGAEIACRLMVRLAGAASRSGARVLILLQYPKTATLADRRLATGVAACARHAGLSVLDLLPELDRLRSEDPDGYAVLIHLHMSPEGNRWVASAVARTLKREGWVERRAER